MAEEKKKGFFARLKEGLTKTRDSLAGRVDQLVVSTREIDDDFTRSSPTSSSWRTSA